MIWRADTDKAHRCPGRMLPYGHPRECPNGYVSCEKTDWRFRNLRTYKCNACGMRVTTFPGWPHYPGTEQYWSRFRWFWTGLPRRSKSRFDLVTRHQQARAGRRIARVIFWLDVRMDNFPGFSREWERLYNAEVERGRKEMKYEEKAENGSLAVDSGNPQGACVLPHRDRAASPSLGWPLQGVQAEAGPQDGLQPQIASRDNSR